MKEDDDSDRKCEYKYKEKNLIYVVEMELTGLQMNWMNKLRKRESKRILSIFAFEWLAEMRKTGVQESSKTDF
jgi:hypothetical protein